MKSAESWWPAEAIALTGKRIEIRRQRRGVIAVGECSRHEIRPDDIGDNYDETIWVEIDAGEIPDRGRRVFFRRSSGSETRGDPWDAAAKSWKHGAVTMRVAGEARKI